MRLRDGAEGVEAPLIRAPPQSRSLLLFGTTLADIACVLAQVVDGRSACVATAQQALSSVVPPGNIWTSLEQRPRTPIYKVSGITLNEEDQVLQNVEIVVQRNGIAAVDQDAARRRLRRNSPWPRDGGPAFLNAYAVVALTLNRGWAEDLFIHDWLAERIWIAESAPVDHVC
jgi:hypothetical protein